MYKGYKGSKITKRLERYMGYAKTKYEKLSLCGEVDLWEILQGYELIMKQAKWVQQYIYDWISGEGCHESEYSVMNASDGGIYIKHSA